MKLLSIIGLLCCGIAANAQTTPAPPYYQAPSTVYNFPPQNGGTPMVRNPVENNNPSVQASIPILNKPSGLEADMAGYTAATNNRIIYNNSQQNTPVKNRATEGTANVPTAIAATSINSDTVIQVATSPGNETANIVVSSTVIYNNSTGTDVSTTADKNTLTNSNSGNSYPIRQTYIAENVVNRFKTMYDKNLYDIRQVRFGANRTIYIIRLLKDGFFTTMYLDENGEVVQQ